MAEPPSSDELRDAVHEILRTHDLEQVTLRMVMNMLCERFSLPRETLTPQKSFVRATINHFLEHDFPNDVQQQQQHPNVGDKRRAADDDNDAAASSTATDPSATTSAGPSAVNGATRTIPTKPVKLTGLERPVVLAQPLADFLGEVVIPRSHIPKRISAYAKQHSLQDPSDGRKINCDQALKTALNVDSFTFFSLARLISGLVYKPDECDPELQELAKQCEEKLIEEKKRRLAESGNDVAAAGGGRRGKGRATKKAKTAATTTGTAAGDGEVKPRKPTGLQKPMQLSDALIAVVGDTQLPRSEVLKKIWHYIREHGLQDPENGRRILCDEKLMAVFDGSKTVSNMGITKYLSAHMTKIEEG